MRRDSFVFISILILYSQIGWLVLLRVIKASWCSQGPGNGTLVGFALLFYYFGGIYIFFIWRQIQLPRCYCLNKLYAVQFC